MKTLIWICLLGLVLCDLVGCGPTKKASCTCGDKCACKDCGCLNGSPTMGCSCKK